MVLSHNLYEKFVTDNVNCEPHHANCK